MIEKTLANSEGLGGEQACLSRAYKSVWTRINKTCLSSGRGDRPPELIAVSKGQGLEKIRVLFAAGQKKFGENYAQELASKAQALRDLPIHWVFLGQLQSNKIKAIVGWADEIQAVGSLKQARLIAQAAEALGKNQPYPIYLSVNAEQEPQKGGISFQEALALVEDISQQLPSLEVKGLMAIPSQAVSLMAAQGQPPTLYTQLRQWAKQIGKGQLSLGMSQDFEAALAAGSDCLRIGTEIFGQRS